MTGMTRSRRPLAGVGPPAPSVPLPHLDPDAAVGQLLLADAVPTLPGLDLGLLDGVQLDEPVEVPIGPEIDPGVPILTASGGRKLGLALNSGNFGAEDFFAKAAAMLAGQRRA